jgi:DNA modification methylase
MTFRNEIVLGDCRELGAQIADHGVDCVFTDPPYPTEYLYLYDWLFEWAARVLKPDGFLITYLGNIHEDTVMQKARPWLSHFWTFVYVNGGSDSSIVWDRMVISRAKLLLCYRLVGSTAKPRTTVLGVWVGSGADKHYHTWGQDESTARYYIDCFTQPGDLVADPFCGGGTVPYVCTVLGRDWIAFDNDPVAVETTRERLKAVQPMLPLPEQAAMTLDLEQEALSTERSHK